MHVSTAVISHILTQYTVLRMWFLNYPATSNKMMILGRLVIAVIVIHDEWWFSSPVADR